MEKDFTEMINQNKGIIFKVCNMYCRDAEDKKDLFQEIVLQLWKAIPGFRNESLLSTWMYRVALNTAISHFRKTKRRPEEIELSRSAFQIPDLAAHDPQDETSILMEAIQQLTKIERALILLYLEEKTYDEISDITGLTRTNVGVKLNRIKPKLEKIIKSISHANR